MQGVIMSGPTARAIQRRGGNLYIWQDSAYMLHARTRAPDVAMLCDTFDGDRWVVHVAGELGLPMRWVIEYRRFPWPHFNPLYDPPGSAYPGRLTIVDVLLGWLDR